MRPELLRIVRIEFVAQFIAESEMVARRLLKKDIVPSINARVQPNFILEENLSPRG